MNEYTPTPLLTCLVCLVPLLVGGAAGWLLKSRVLAMGLPWGLLPMGGLLKQIWDNLK